MEGGLVEFVVASVEGPHRLASRNKLIGISERICVRYVDHVTKRLDRPVHRESSFKGRVFVQ